MYKEKEDFLHRYAENGRADDSIWRITPYSRPDQVGIPRSSREDSDLIFVSVGSQGAVASTALTAMRNRIL